MCEWDGKRSYYRWEKQSLNVKRCSLFSISIIIYVTSTTYYYIFKFRFEIWFLFQMFMSFLIIHLCVRFEVRSSLPASTNSSIPYYRTSLAYAATQTNVCVFYTTDSARWTPVFSQPWTKRHWKSRSKTWSTKRPWNAGRYLKALPRE